MAISLTIGGTAYVLLARTMHIEDQLRTASELECSVRYTTGTQPTRGQEIKVTVDGTLLFTGVIMLARRIDEQRGNRIVFHIEAEDYYRNFRRVTIAKTWASSTLKQILTDIISDVPGVTLHPSQDDGPTLANIRSNYMKANDLVRNLGDVTDRLWHVDEQKRFRMYTHTTLSAPFQVGGTAADSTNPVGDVDYDIDESEYVNEAMVVSDLQAGDTEVETFEGDGSTTAFEVSEDYLGEPEIFVNGESQSVSESDADAQWSSEQYSRTVTAAEAPFGEILYIADDTGNNLWEVTDVDNPVTATSVGDLPTSLADPYAVASIGRIIYIVHIGGTDSLWEFTNPSNPGGGVRKGSLPSGLANARGMTSLNGNLYIVTDNQTPATRELWEVTDVNNPGGATNKGDLPSGLGSPRAMAALNGNLYIADNSGDELWEITDVDNPGGATNKGSLPSGLVTPRGMAVRAGNLYIVDESGDELWELTDVDNPGGATDKGDLPSGITVPSGMTALPTVIEVRYNPVKQIIAVSSDSAEIASEGKYTDPVHARGVTQTEADEIASVHLRKFKHLVRHLGVRTYELGARSGHQLTSALTTPPATGTFLIDLVTYTDVDGQHLLCQLRASDAEGDDDWKELWKEDLTGEIVSTVPVYDVNGNKL